MLHKDPKYEIAKRNIVSSLFFFYNNNEECFYFFHLFKELESRIYCIDEEEEEKKIDLYDSNISEKNPYKDADTSGLIQCPDSKKPKTNGIS